MSLLFEHLFGSVLGMRMIDRWWCETPPTRHIHLRAADGRWRLLTTIGDTPPRATDYASETAARAAAQAFMDAHPGHWQRQPTSRSAAPD